jgi:hypothetical protein
MSTTTEKSPPKSPRSIALAVTGLSALIALCAPSAMAAKGKAVMATEVAPVVCPGQVFSQPFAALEDSRYYTLAPGGEFNSPTEGWTLSGGARLITTSRPDGSTGGALDLKGGALATSPPICVTLAYPIARVWVNGVSGSRGVAVRVSYANTQSELEPKDVGKVGSPHGSWTLGEFNVAPQLAGREEAAREVRFIFEGRKNTESDLYDLYIDPRMHH